MRSFEARLLICIVAGVLSGMLNFSYAFGKPITLIAQHLGATKENSLNAVCLLALPAGGILNIGYCVFLIVRRRSWWLLYEQPSAVDWGAFLMAGLWTGSVMIYGWGAAGLGRPGPSLDWSLWDAVMIMTTVVCGLLTHEWDGVQGLPIHVPLLGIGALILASVLLGIGGVGSLG